MSISNRQLSDYQEEEFYRDRSLVEADKLEEERKLWQWMSEDSVMKNVVKETPIEGKKSYLYKENNDTNLALNF